MKKIEFENLGSYPEIEEIFNEIYQDFITRYGTKHVDRIKQQLIQISKNVKKVDLYQGALAMANKERGVLYGKSNNLSAILKHELCHIFNDSYFDSKDETCLTYFPDKYKDFLEEKGILQETYKKTQEEYKEKWKDEPERLKYLLVDYEKYKDKFSYGDGSQETEKWTEWFNTKINQRDMKNYFRYFGEGFYIKNFSSNSFYDNYIGIAEMVSKLIPEDKLIDMYMETPEYNTDFSYKDLIEMFDSTYTETLDEQEKQEFKYPYLKILNDTKQIEDNARGNNNIARKAYQSCTKTCFRAYLQKINSIEQFDEKTLKVLYNEIKDLQESMIWNIDTSKMSELGYIKVLNQIQDKFKDMCNSVNVDKQSNEIIKMQENIDYKCNNKFKMVENGEKIAKELFNDNKQTSKIINIGKYKINAQKSGLKSNLYESIKTLFGNETLNLLFEQYKDENISFLTNSKDRNELVELFNKIQKLDNNLQVDQNEKEVLSLYDEIYNLYNKKINEQIITDENVAFEFKAISNEIVKLEKNSLIDVKKSKFPNSLELLIENYKKKEQEYELFIKSATEKKIENILKEEKSSKLTDEERIERAWITPNEETKKLKEYILKIENTRAELIETLGKEEKHEILPQHIGRATINIETEKKDIAKNQIQTYLHKNQEIDKSR